MTDALGIVLKALLTPLGWFTDIMYQANALALYLVMFLIGAVLRMFLRPILGEGIREIRTETRKAGKENYKKIRGGD